MMIFKNKLMKTFVFTILLIAFFPAGRLIYAGEVSEPVVRFVEEGKQVRLKILKDYQEVSLIPQTELNFSLITETGTDYIKLKAGKKYQIKPVKGTGPDKTEKILGIYQKNNLIKKGNYITGAGNLQISGREFSGKFEFLYRKGEVRIYNTTELVDILQGILEQEKNIEQNNFLTSLKAEAIYWRSYILSLINTKQKGYINLNYYQGKTGLHKDLIKRAIDSTTGKVLSNYLKEVPDPDLFSRHRSQIMAGARFSYQDIVTNIYPETEVVNLKRVVLEEKIEIESELASGLAYQKISQKTWSGPRIITMLNLDLTASGLKVTPFISNNVLTGFIDLYDIIGKNGTLAAINGGFFGPTGRPLGLLKIDGEIVSAPGHNRTAVAFTDTGDVLINKVKWKGFINNKIEVEGINYYSPDKDIIVFNNYYGKQITDIQSDMKFIYIKEETIVDIKDGSDYREDIVNIPEDGYLILIKAEAKNKVSDLNIGDSIKLENQFLPEWQEENIISILEAGPGLLDEGQIRITGVEEEFQSDVLEGRAPRSALGIKENNNLLLVTVNGRQPEVSIGMTLKELAKFMKSKDAVRAMNLDGGYSAQMVTENFGIDHTFHRRLIPNGILVKNAGN